MCWTKALSVIIIDTTYGELQTSDNNKETKVNHKLKWECAEFRNIHFGTLLFCALAPELYKFVQNMSCD